MGCQQETRERRSWNLGFIAPRKTSSLVSRDTQSHSGDCALGAQAEQSPRISEFCSWEAPGETTGLELGSSTVNCRCHLSSQPFLGFATSPPSLGPGSGDLSTTGVPQELCARLTGRDKNGSRGMGRG